jgi:hypothetical protein
MTFDHAVRQAAREARAAVEATVQQYKSERVTDEDDLTGVLVGQLGARLTGQIAGLTWDTSVVRHRKGRAAEEDRTGADIVIHVTMNTNEKSYSKGVLIQAKRREPDEQMSRADFDALRRQCRKMLRISPSAFVFDYSKLGIRSGSATGISGLQDRPDLYRKCEWTAYRFFLELFRCPVGDPRLASARVRDLPVPTLVEMKAEGEF